ncbi:MAG: C39 family peptidase [Synergistaceae bacterium]|jgi:uncharacterized protein YukE|nr:C39 family peptidase [Synergistaceae bacterium]
MPKILAITETMHGNAKNILARAGEIQSSHGEMERITNGMAPYFSGTLPELLTQRLHDMKKKHEALYEKISQYSEKVDFAADNYDWSDQEIAGWAGRLGVGVAMLKSGGAGGTGTDSTGTGSGFRYFSQTNNPDEWGNYTDYMYTGCNIASFSMALSSMGINVTPGDVTGVNEELLRNSKYSVGNGDGQYHPTYLNGSTLAPEYGTKYTSVGTSASNIDDYLTQHAQNPEKYSLPVVKIEEANSPSGVHFIVITGKDEAGNYTIADPASSNHRTISASQITSAYRLEAV